MKEILKNPGSSFMTIPTGISATRYPSDGVGGVQTTLPGNFTERAAEVLVNVLHLLSDVTTTVTVDVSGGSETLFTGTLALTANETLELDFGGANLPANLQLTTLFTSGTQTSATLFFSQTSRYGG